MIRQYKNKKIYKNLKIAQIIATISCVFFCILFSGDLFTLITTKRIKVYIDLTRAVLSEGGLLMYFNLYHLIPILTCVNIIKYCKSSRRENSTKTKIIHESGSENDVKKTKEQIYLSLLGPLCVFLCITLYFINYPSSLTVFGKIIDTLSSTIGQFLLIFIADIFLGKTCKLIRQEWEENPPPFLIEQEKIRAEKEQIAAEEKAAAEEARKINTYEKLIYKCGARFFIKYYRQIENLPLRDVQITEDYSYEEKEERLQAALKIIENDLQILAFEQILESYCEMLSKEEVETAKQILQDLKNKKEDEITR